VPAALRAAAADPAHVLGIGIDFTACTMVPTTADDTPLCDLAECTDEPRTPTSSSGSTIRPSRRPTGSTSWRASGRSRGCRATAG
jgi:hypothetical protein